MMPPAPTVGVSSGIAASGGQVGRCSPGLQMPLECSRCTGALADITESLIQGGALASSVGAAPVRTESSVACRLLP